MNDPLLSREEFKRRVFARSKGKCVFCLKDAVDAHHILERKLFKDGGYYLSNGAAVCEEHHLLCEQTLISVEDVRTAARIVRPKLPAGFNLNVKYDKWGNIVEGEKWQKGPLFEDEGCRKMLTLSGKIYLF